MASSTKAAFAGRYDTIPGLYSTTDLSAAQFKVVKLLSTGGQIALISTSVALIGAIHGILQNDPKGTSSLPVNAEVAISGICKAVVGGAVTRGAHLTTNTTGQLVATTTDNACTVARALQAAGTAGYIISVWVQQGGQRY